MKMYRYFLIYILLLAASAIYAADSTQIAPKNNSVPTRVAVDILHIQGSNTPFCFWGSCYPPYITPHCSSYGKAEGITLYTPLNQWPYQYITVYHCKEWMWSSDPNYSTWFSRNWISGNSLPGDPYCQTSSDTEVCSAINTKAPIVKFSLGQPVGLAPFGNGGGAFYRPTQTLPSGAANGYSYIISAANVNGSLSRVIYQSPRTPAMLNPVSLPVTLWLDSYGWPDSGDSSNGNFQSEFLMMTIFIDWFADQNYNSGHYYYCTAGWPGYSQGGWMLYISNQIFEKTCALTCNTMPWQTMGPLPPTPIGRSTDYAFWVAYGAISCS